MSDFLEIRELSKIFGKEPQTVTAVDAASLSISEGELVSFLGPSGCGKTTLLRMLAGFEKPSSGEIHLQGQDLTKQEAYQRDSAMVFQSYALFPHMSVRENIEYGLKLRKISAQERARRLEEISQLVGLGSLLERSSAELSGGQQQRVALARALVVKPKLLLFDEPLSNLDAQLRQHMRNEIRRIQKESGITAIYVTHDQAEAMAISDRIVIMKSGVIQQVAPPEEIYEKPLNPFVANFVGKANLLSLRREGKDWRLGGSLLQTKFDWNIPQQKETQVMLRPERVKLESGECEIRFHLLRKTYFGAYWELEFETEDQQVFEVHSRSNEISHLKIGQPLPLYFDACDLFIFCDS